MGYELIPGTITDFTDDGGTTWQNIPKLQEIPEFGMDGSFSKVTGVTDTVHEYVGSMQDTPDATLTFIATGDPAEQALIDAADAMENIKFRLTFPSGTIWTMDYATSGWKAVKIEDTQGYAINVKQSGRPVKS